MITRIEIAGLTVEISHRYELLREYCNGYLTESGSFDITVSVSDADIDYEREKSRRECEYEGLIYPDYSPAELELTAVYRKIAKKLPEFGGVVFHGSAVAVGKKAYLFTAKSGTGKTTHTNLWLENIEGAYIVNGDKPVIRIVDGTAFVCGTPWSGKESINTRVNVPLSSICVLERGAENKIDKVDFKEIMPLVIQQTYRPGEPSALVSTLKIIDELSNTVDFYRLHCNMNPDAATTAYGEMSK